MGTAVHGMCVLGVVPGLAPKEPRKLGEMPHLGVGVTESRSHRILEINPGGCPILL